MLACLRVPCAAAAAARRLASTASASTSSAFVSHLMLAQRNAAQTLQAEIGQVPRVLGAHPTLWYRLNEKDAAVQAMIAGASAGADRRTRLLAAAPSAGKPSSHEVFFKHPRFGTAVADLEALGYVVGVDSSLELVPAGDEAVRRLGTVRGRGIVAYTSDEARAVGLSLRACWLDLVHERTHVLMQRLLIDPAGGADAVVANPALLSQAAARLSGPASAPKGVSERVVAECQAIAKRAEALFAEGYTLRAVEERIAVESEMAELAADKFSKLSSPYVERLDYALAVLVDELSRLGPSLTGKQSYARALLSKSKRTRLLYSKRSARWVTIGLILCFGSILEMHKSGLPIVVVAAGVVGAGLATVTTMAALA